jgi:hypothetical protein
MRATEEGDEVCVFFPMSDGRALLDMLIEHNIPHDTQQWTVGWENYHNQYIKITRDGEILVKDIEGVHVEQDGFHEYWRYKPRE